MEEERDLAAISLEEEGDLLAVGEEMDFLAVGVE